MRRLAEAVKRVGKVEEKMRHTSSAPSSAPLDEFHGSVADAPPAASTASNGKAFGV